MDSLGRILPGVVARQREGSGLIDSHLTLILRRLLGEELSRSLGKVELRRGVLWVRTRNPALAEQLREDAELLCQRLREDGHMGGRLREVRIRPDFDA